MFEEKRTKLAYFFNLLLIYSEPSELHENMQTTVSLFQNCELHIALEAYLINHLLYFSKKKNSAIDKSRIKASCKCQRKGINPFVLSHGDLTSVFYSHTSILLEVTAPIASLKASTFVQRTTRG